MNDELIARIAIIEVKAENVEKTLEKMDMNLSENYRVTLQIKERLDKQNGAIPHLVEDVKELQKGQKELLDSVIKNTIADTESKTRLKILWRNISYFRSCGYRNSNKITFSLNNLLIMSIKVTHLQL